MQDAQRVAGIDVDEVEPGLARPERRRPVPAAEVADVLLVHRTGLHRLVAGGRDRHRGRGKRHVARVVVGGVRAVVGKLDPRQRAEFVDAVHRPRERRDVAVVPEPKLDEGGDVRGGVDLHLLGADHGPAALRLDPAHPGERRGVAVAHAVAVRHLEEAVVRGHWADRDRLEEHVEAGVALCAAGHSESPWVAGSQLTRSRPVPLRPSPSCDLGYPPASASSDALPPAAVVSTQRWRSST
ncbi:MAG: hypothetical protein OXP75_16055 [Rhodospirillales bacterium]|nr:hypothetical protein [Rhodospirillales bacterium]